MYYLGFIRAIWTRLAGDRSGQSTVEFVGLAPVVVLVVLMAWQLIVAGHTAWLTANAARSAARAKAVGHNPKQAARRALPDGLEKGLKVSDLDSSQGSKVRVRVHVPLLINNWQTPIKVSANADLPTQTGAASTVGSADG